MVGRQNHEGFSRREFLASSAAAGSTIGIAALADTAIGRAAIASSRARTAAQLFSAPLIPFRTSLSVINPFDEEVLAAVSR